MRSRLPGNILMGNVYGALFVLLPPWSPYNTLTTLLSFHDCFNARGLYSFGFNVEKSVIDIKQLTSLLRCNRGRGHCVPFGVLS